MSPSISNPPGFESPGAAVRQLTVSAAIASALKLLKAFASEGTASPTDAAALLVADGFLVGVLLAELEPSELGPRDPAPAAPAAEPAPSAEAGPAPRAIMLPTASTTRVDSVRASGRL